MASSSDITEMKRYLLANGQCMNCPSSRCAQCVALYELLGRKSQSGTLSSNDITEIKRLIISNMPCTICMNSKAP